MNNFQIVRILRGSYWLQKRDGSWITTDRDSYYRVMHMPHIVACEDWSTYRGSALWSLAMSAAVALAIVVAVMS